MAEVCNHVFGKASDVFTGGAQIRACMNCNRIEVLPLSRGQWMFLDEYVRWRMATRTSAQ